MNCLDYKTSKEYFKKLYKMTEEELEFEFMKNFFISNNLELHYNIIRSRLFLEFFAPTNYFLNKTHGYTIETIKKAVHESVSWCSTYLDVANVVRQTDREELLKDIDVPINNLLERTKHLCLKAFGYFNTLVELCVSSKNHLLYLSKRIFNQNNYPELNQVFSYEGECSFESEEEVEKFGETHGIGKGENDIEVIKEVHESLLSEIKLNDQMFQKT